MEIIIEKSKETQISSFLAPSIYKIAEKYNINSMQTLILLSRIYAYNKNGQTCYESQDTLKKYIMRISRCTVWRKISGCLKAIGILKVSRKKVFPSTNEYYIESKTLKWMTEFDDRIYKKNKNGEKEVNPYAVITMKEWNEQKTSTKAIKRINTSSYSKTNEFKHAWEKYCTSSEAELIKNYEKMITTLSLNTEEKKEYSFLKKEKVLEAIASTEKILCKVKGKGITNCYRWFKSTLYSRIKKGLKVEEILILDNLINWAEKGVFYEGSDWLFEKRKEVYLREHPKEDPPK